MRLFPTSHRRNRKATHQPMGLHHPPTHPPTSARLQQPLPHILIHWQVAEQEVGQLKGIALELASLAGSGAQEGWWVHTLLNVDHMRR